MIASTWRLQLPLDGLRAWLSPDVAHRVVGITAEFSQLDSVPESPQALERKAECNAWLRANEHVVFPWLAIDDLSWLYCPFNRFLFLEDGKTGMSAAVAEELIGRLNGM